MDKSRSYHNTPRKRGFLCFKTEVKNWKELPERKINAGVPDEQLPLNKITTAKYTWYNFLPKNLIEQFTYMANCYFLVHDCIVTLLTLIGDSGASDPP